MNLSRTDRVSVAVGASFCLSSEICILLVNKLVRMFETCSFGAPLSREVEAATVLDRSDISPLCSRSVLPEPDPEPPEPEHWRTEGRRGLRLLVTIIEVQEALLPLLGPKERCVTVSVPLVLIFVCDSSIISIIQFEI